MTFWKSTKPVLMTADAIGGVWTYALELCRELGRCGVRVALATLGRRLTEAERAATAHIGNIELFESAYKLEWMVDPWDDLQKSNDWLLDLEARVQPALIHSNGFCHGALRWKVPCLVVGHSCVYSWFDAVRGKPPSEEWQRYRQTVEIGLRGADRVTAPSHFMMRALERHYGCFAAAGPVYNGRSAGLFAPAAKEPFVITIGRLWDEAKNIAILQQVAGRLPWAIYAAGDTRAPDGAETAFDDLVMIGRLDQQALAERLARASIFVLPARYEPFGFSALEAALAGCALVLGDISSLREIWGDAALFVDPDDADAIAAAVLQMIKDDSLRHRLAHRARQRAQQFTAERMAQGYLTLYRQMLSERAQTIAESSSRAPVGAVTAR
jgi:glycosyltransferase involved in cell wall biosynthesis